MREPKLPTAYRLVKLDTVDSTNDEAKRRARAGEDEAPEGTLVWALEQTAGRGRLGRRWMSPKGNLYFSLILRPEVPLARAAELGFVASLALFDAIGSVGEPGHKVECKWPNDILLNDSKVAGILLEAETSGGEVPDWLVLGIGVNVGVFPGDVEFPATSFRAENMAASEVDCLEAFCRAFITWTGKWRDEGFEPVRKTWLWRAHGRDEEIEARLANETVTGVFTDIDDTGALVIETAAGPRTVAAGDVFFADD